MGNYLANQIIRGALDYLLVLEAFPQHKETIDLYLQSKGKDDLIVEPTETP